MSNRMNENSDEKKKCFGVRGPLGRFKDVGDDVRQRAEWLTSDERSSGERGSSPAMAALFRSTTWSSSAATVDASSSDVVDGVGPRAAG